ncbi:MAG: hypothetical protein ACJAUG_002949 [Halioglobus sp.]|jgi:hypothetical protein
MASCCGHLGGGSRSVGYRAISFSNSSLRGTSLCWQLVPVEAPATVHLCQINYQWRLLFRWNGGQSQNVQILDYHK